jgi:hypothetical protein
MIYPYWATAMPSTPTATTKRQFCPDFLRDYTPEGFPYNTANFVFLGDNTTSARGKFKIDMITLTDEAIAAAPVPTPALLPGLVPAFLMAGWRIAKKSAK